MAKVRKPLEMAREKRGVAYVVYFWHPLRGRTERIKLGDDAGIAGVKLGKLNAIFTDPKNWDDPPEGTPEDIRVAWLGSDAETKLRPGRIVQGKLETNLSDAEAFQMKLDLEFYKGECERLTGLLRARDRELEHWRGKKTRGDAPCPKLGEACAAWLAKYKGRDADHTKNTGYDLWRFVKHFDPEKNGIPAGSKVEVDDFAGREKDIDVWLRGMTKKKKVLGELQKDPVTGEEKPLVEYRDVPVGAGRRAQIRRAVLRFLEDSGAAIHRKSVTTIKKKEVRAGRGRIRWLEREQAEAMAKALPAPWNDYFRVQVALGPRPDELITLKRDDFPEDFKTMTLSPLGDLTLKQGSRSVQVPEAVRGIIKRRLEKSDVVFPDPATGKPWENPKDYNKAYNRALKAAAEAAGIMTKVDCRIGRRTCASLLLRAGKSVEAVASILGDDPATIREHYAAILPHEVDPSAAALKDMEVKE